MYVRFDEPFDANTYNNLQKKIAQRRTKQVAKRQPKDSPRAKGRSALPPNQNKPIAGDGEGTSANNNQRLSIGVLPERGNDVSSRNKGSRLMAPAPQGHTLQLPSIKIPGEEPATFIPLDNVSLPPIRPLIRFAAHPTGKDIISPIGSTLTTPFKETCRDIAAQPPATGAGPSYGAITESADSEIGSRMDEDTGDTGDVRSPNDFEVRWQRSTATPETTERSVVGSVDAATSHWSSAHSQSTQNATSEDGPPREMGLEMYDSSSADELEDCIEVAPPPIDTDTGSYARPLGSSDDGTPTDEWEVRCIVGEEEIDGKLHYMVEWKPTLVSEDDAHNITQLIKEWQKRKTQIQARARRSKKRQPLPSVQG